MARNGPSWLPTAPNPAQIDPRTVPDPNFGVPGPKKPKKIALGALGGQVAYFLKFKNRRRQLVERSPGFYAPNPTRFGSPAGVPTFVGMNRRNPGSKPTHDEAKGELVGKPYLRDRWGLRIGPQQGPY